MRDASRFRLVAAALTLLTAGCDCRHHDSQNKGINQMWAIEGEDVQIPCNIKSNNEVNDSVTMVLWFKDEGGIPLYNLDARGGDLYKAVHWTMSSSLGNRTYFQVDTNGLARLKIKAVTKEDQGLFRCRVDFAKSPTYNFRVNLTLIEEPSKPVIYDSRGREITGVGGPFLEGYDFLLNCQVSGGKPRPTVTWWKDDEMIDGVMEESVGLPTNSKFTENRLAIHPVTRDLWGARLECRAESRTPDKSRVVVRKVPLDIYLKPAVVNINLSENEIYAGRPITATCETWGSSPAARIIWRLGGLLKGESSLTTTQRTNSTVSKMALNLDKNDDGKELTCRAENPHFPGGVLEKTRILRVLYAPSAIAELGTGFDRDNLREGDDVKFVCNYQSNPEPTSIEWFHNNQRLYHDIKNGILLSSSTLTLRELALEDTGTYICIVRNIVGETRSTPITIYMKYTPRCKLGHDYQDIISSPGETIRMRCEIEADPRDGVRFSWTRNSSVGDVYPVSNPRSHSSILDYTPRNEEDFGTLACWASNSIGRQKSPCVFNLIPAKPPQSPSECSIRNESSAMEVNCVPGSSGGLAQHFLLEVHGILGNSSVLQQMMPQSDQGEPPELASPPVYFERSDEPTFQLVGLQPGYEYTVAVYAENSRGRSLPVLIENVRVSESSPWRMAEGRFMDNIARVLPDVAMLDNPFFVIGVIVTVVIILIGIGIAVGVSTCLKRANPPVNEGPDDFTTPTYISAQRIEPRIRYGNEKRRSQRTSLYMEESRNEPDLLQQVDIDIHN